MSFLYLCFIALFVFSLPLFLILTSVPVQQQGGVPISHILFFHLPSLSLSSAGYPQAPHAALQPLAPKHAELREPERRERFDKRCRCDRGLFSGEWVLNPDLKPFRLKKHEWENSLFCGVCGS
ncbi:hypothetical protein GGI42DRAFT_318619 [Trichoderma sp. SZMC 28013]